MEGDAALDALYREHAPEIIRLLRFGFTVTNRDGRSIRAQIPDMFDAEELCHEVFSAFFKQHQSGQFDRSRPVGPYIRRIAMNLALKRLRRAGREVLTEVETLEAVAAPARDDDRELRQLVRMFKGQLDPRAQQVVVEYFEHGHSQEAVAQTLGLSRDQVYRSIVKIRRAALAYFKESGWFDEP